MSVPHSSVVGVFLLGVLLIVLPLGVFFPQPQLQTQEYAATVTTPSLERDEQVTTNAFGDGSSYVPMGWGNMKSRIVRTASDDIIVPYLVPGHKWGIMHRDPISGAWQQTAQGTGGTEPPNIVKGPDDSVHVFVWPGDSGTLLDERSTDNGRTFSSIQIPGQWVAQQGYSGAGIDANGDMVVLQTNNDQPYQFWWSYFNPQTKQWTFHTDHPSQGYGYPFIFPGNNSFSLVAMRDMHYSELNCSNPGGFDYLFSEIHNFYYTDVANPSLQGVQVKQEACNAANTHILTYLVDAYQDMKGNMHVLYYDGVTNGERETIIQSNTVIKDVAESVAVPIETRMVQDTTGRFYLITVNNNTLLVYPASSSDTDGTQFDPPVSFPLQYAGCTDYDFCLPPTMTVPRSGNAVSDIVDGIYGNMNKINYFRLRLRTGSSTSPTGNPSPTSSGGGTNFSLTLCPHGLGHCGDNVNPTGAGNSTPKHQQRAVILTLLNAQNQPVGTIQGTVSYTSSSSNFQGAIRGTLPNGNYLVKIQTDGYLPKQAPGIITVTTGQQITLPSVSLVTGDINNDGQIDILDYNILIDCFGSKQNTSSCTNPPTTQSVGADLDDDDIVSGGDYNLFLRELSVEYGG